MPRKDVSTLNVHEATICDMMTQDKMGETIPILPVLLPIRAILLIWVMRHKDWLQVRLLGENGVLPKLWSWYRGKSLRREWYQGKAVLITGCDSGLGYRCAAITFAKFKINLIFLPDRREREYILSTLFVALSLVLFCLHIPAAE